MDNKEIASDLLASKNINQIHLIENYKMQLNSAMFDWELDGQAIRRLSKTGDADYDRLFDAATEVLKRQCTWPYPDSVAGIDLGHHLFEAAKQATQASWHSYIQSMSHVVAKAFAAVKNDGISQIPKDIIDAEIVLLAVKCNPAQISSIDDKWLSEEVLTIAINKRPKTLSLIRDSILNQKLVDLAVSKDGSVVLNINSKYINPNLLLKAAEVSPWIVTASTALPFEQEHYAIAMESNGLFIDDLYGFKPEAVNDDLISKAIKSNRLALASVFNSMGAEAIKPGIIRKAIKWHPGIENEKWFNNIRKEIRSARKEESPSP